MTSRNKFRIKRNIQTISSRNFKKEIRDGKLLFDGNSVHDKLMYKVCREADIDNTKDNNPTLTKCANPECSAPLVKDLIETDYLEAETKYIGSMPH